MPRDRQFHYETCCVHSTAELIDAMTEQAREVTYRTARQHIADLDEWAEGQCYSKRSSNGLTLKNDWHVSYYKSQYAGKPCYYIVHSAIEHIFTKKGSQ